MSRVMAFLAEYWIAGYSVCTVVCVGVYLLYSIRLVKSCRKVGYDVGVSAMIPVWNIITLIRKKCIVKKSKKLALQEEIDLDL